jgi:hypothetical protein
MTVVSRAACRGATRAQLLPCAHREEREREFTVMHSAVLRGLEQCRLHAGLNRIRVCNCAGFGVNLGPERDGVFQNVN